VVKFYPIDKYESSDLKDDISLTIRFILQSPEKTLDDNDINAILSPILEELSEKGIKLR